MTYTYCLKFETGLRRITTSDDKKNRKTKKHVKKRITAISRAFRTYIKTEIRFETGSHGTNVTSSLCDVIIDPLIRSNKKI